jgi:hypothetical protein
MDKELKEIKRKYEILKEYLPVFPFTFVLKSTDSVNLPFYTGSTFRGLFGIAFKRISCTLSRTGSISKKFEHVKEKS